MSIIQQMRDATQLKTLNAKGRMVSTDPWLERLAIRKVSIYVTWLFVKLGLSANAATTLMLVCGLGFILLIPHNLYLNILGLLMHVLFRVLDCVDGEIARWTKKSTVRGLYLDLCSHVFCNPGWSMIAAAHYFFWRGGQDNTFLYIALIIYIAGQWRQGVRLAADVARKEVMTDSEKRKVQKAKAAQVQTPSLGKRLRHLSETIIKAPNDPLAILAANVGAVFASYWGHEAPLKTVAWFYLFYGPPMVPLVTAAKYFRMPEAKHEKDHSIDVH